MATADAALAAVERLQRLVPQLAEGDPDHRWLAQAVSRYLQEAPAGLDLDRALGLGVAPGGSPWWHAHRHAERDRLLRELAAGLPGATHARAVALQQLLRRYSASSWPRDRLSKSPTAVNEPLYRVRSLDPDCPTGVRRLTEIIAP